MRYHPRVDNQLHSPDHAHLRNLRTTAYALMEYALEPTLLLSSAGVIQLSNPAMAALIGATATDTLLSDYLNSDDKLLLQRNLDNLRLNHQPQQFIAGYPEPGNEQQYYQHLLIPVMHEQQLLAVLVQLHAANQAERHLQQQVSQLQTLLALIFKHSPIALWMTDRDGIMTFSEGAGLLDRGLTPEHIIGTSIFALYQDYPNILSATRKALQGQAATTVITIQQQIYHVHYQPMLNTQQQIIGCVGVASDITDVQNTLTQMQTLSSALEQTADMVMITDRDGKIEYVNPAFEQITGYSRDEVLHKNPVVFNSGKQERSFYKNLWDTILGGDPFSEVFINKRKDNSIYYEEKTITPIRNAKGEIAHFVATGRDVSDRMRTQERMQFMAHHDALTRLPNRTLFMDRLRQAMARSHWHKRMVAVVILDLDNFSLLNAQHGQAHGDLILQQLAKRLTGSVRTGDTVARFGSDEFAILLEDMASEKDVLQLAKKILDTLIPPFVIDNRECTTTASLGVSIYPDDGDDAEGLLRNADTAMYRAKNIGRNTYRFYSSDLSARVSERLSLETSLRQALLREEFFLLYQPQFNVSQQRIIGIEALLRWRHPDKGIISPYDFIPALEETGLIAPVGEWVLQHACLQSRRWEQAGIADIVMSINLSGRQFNNPDFFKNIHAIIESTQVNPALLELELTESMLMRNDSKTVSALNSLHHLGVSIAIDDFGTGYSSLNYLRRFPISTLKIDRSFIRDIVENSDDAAIASAIVVMGKSLNQKVIAEGVDNQQQLELLQRYGCQLIQGNLLGEAMPANVIETLLFNQIQITHDR